MQLKKLKIGYIIVIFLLLLTELAGTVHAITLTPANGTTLIAATQGTSYTSDTFTTGGGTPNYTWSATGLPTGLGLTTGGGAQHTTCTITGTPSVSGGPFTINVKVTDNAKPTPATLTYTYYLTVQSEAAVTLTPASGTTLAAATQSTSYTSFTLTAGGGTPNYTWSATGLPTGLTLTPSGGQHTTCTITGTPSVSGSFTINVKVTDTYNSSVTNTYYLTVNSPPVLSPANNAQIYPNAVINVPYTSTTVLTVSGGTPPYTWSNPGGPGGPLPAGLVLSCQTGCGNSITITGTDTAPAGNKPFKVTVTDSNGASDGPNNYNITIIGTGCDFTDGNTENISFGNIDPSSTGTIYGTINTGVQFACVAGTSCTITANPSSAWQLSSGSNNLSYTLGFAPSGTYGTTPVNLFPSNSSNMTQGQYGSAPAGSYSNTAITVTISWTTGGGGSIIANLPIGSVTGTILKTCSASNNGVINFGTLNAVANSGGVAASEALVTTKPTIYCTAGSTYTVTATGANGGTSSGGTSSGYQLKYGTNNIPYTFTYTTPITGSGYTTPIGGSGSNHLAITPSIAAGALNSAQAGTYGDTITFTINY